MTAVPARHVCPSGLCCVWSFGQLSDCLQHWQFQVFTEDCLNCVRTFSALGVNCDDVLQKLSFTLHYIMVSTAKFVCWIYVSYIVTGSAVWVDEGNLPNTVPADEAVHSWGPFYPRWWHVGRDGMMTFVLRCIFMAALWNRAGHYVFALWFLSILFFFLA